MFVPSPFKPLPGLSSPHAQTIVASFIPPGTPPPSTTLVIRLDSEDSLYCQLSLPPSWLEHQKTIVLIHGLCGDDSSNYMVRIGRKLYEAGYRVLRVNLKGSGPGLNLATLPHHGGSSDDVLPVIKYLKDTTPLSPITLIGFSLGGNIALKLAGELGRSNSPLIEKTMAICSPIDLLETVNLLQKPVNRMYQRYYLSEMGRLSKRWSKGEKVSNLYEFDELITAPLCGFESADDYYKKSSCRHYLSSIQHPCYLLLAADDPFVDYQLPSTMSLPPLMKVHVCPNGGHMGFLGWTGTEHRYFWLDQHILNWIAEKNGNGLR